jgi:hypothetical protein
MVARRGTNRDGVEKGHEQRWCREGARTEMVSRRGTNRDGGEKGHEQRWCREGARTHNANIYIMKNIGKLIQKYNLPSLNSSERTTLYIHIYLFIYVLFGMRGGAIG